MDAEPRNKLYPQFDRRYMQRGAATRLIREMVDEALKDFTDQAQANPKMCGPAGTVAVGTTSNGATGVDAQVTNTGTPSAAVLNFLIPRGLKGDPGNPGSPGSPGSPGDPGKAGTTPTFSIGTITTGAPGSNASVTATGTAPNYVLNFSIPRGNTGADAQNLFSMGIKDESTPLSVGGSRAIQVALKLPQPNTNYTPQAFILNTGGIGLGTVEITGYSNISGSQCNVTVKNNGISLLSSFRVVLFALNNA